MPWKLVVSDMINAAGQKRRDREKERQNLRHASSDYVTRALSRAVCYALQPLLLGVSLEERDAALHPLRLLLLF